MIFNRVIFLLCILLVESKSVLKVDETDHTDISEETTVTVPKNVEDEETNARSRRAVLEPWILFDSDERELFKRSTEERDWFKNYKAVQRNLVLSFLRDKRSVGNENVESDESSDNNELSLPELKRRHLDRRSVNSFTGGMGFDQYMGRF